MGRIFASQADSTAVTDLKDKTLADLVVTANVPSLTWQELARFNWGTAAHAEVNRALVETIGCSKVDDADPSKTVLDPALGPGGTPKIFLPKLWPGADNLAANKTHTVALKQRRPPTAVAITELTSWFVPKTGKCDFKYQLEGVAARADKTDFEVHVASFLENEKGRRERRSSYWEEKKAARDTSRAAGPDS